MSALTETNVTYANFAVSWKIEWSEFNELSKQNITKCFITSYKNLPLIWSVQFSTEMKETESDKISNTFHFFDGPLAKLKDIEFTMAISQPGSSVSKKFNSGKCEMDHDAVRGLVNFAPRSAESFQARFNLTDSEPFFCHVTLKIPFAMFSLTLENPLAGAASTAWLQELFQQIDNPEKVVYANAKLISREGDAFYCDKVIIGKQSEEFAAMFRHPTAKNQIEGEYNFPKLSTIALKTLIEFIYTSNATFENLSTKDVVEVADAAEQYNFEILKKACEGCLWRRVVENPKDAFDIASFADLHDVRYLKFRAMDVLVDNYKTFALHEAHLSGNFSGWADSLISEFHLFAHCRLGVHFSF